MLPKAWSPPTASTRKLRAPPFEREAWRALGFMERLGARWWPLAGGVRHFGGQARAWHAPAGPTTLSLLTPAPLAGVATPGGPARRGVSLSEPPKPLP